MGLQSATCCISAICCGLQVLFFLRAASPSLLCRIIESFTPILEMENGGRGDACPKPNSMCQRLHFHANGYTLMPVIAQVVRLPTATHSRLLIIDATGTHMCQRLRMCVNRVAPTATYVVPTATHMCQRLLLPSAQKHKTLSWDLNFLRRKQPQSTPPGRGPGHQRVRIATCSSTSLLRSFMFEDRPA